MHEDEFFSPEESEERNQQLFSDLHTLYGSGSSNEITQHLKLVRERLLQNQNVPLHQQNGTFKQPVVLEARQERHTNMNSSFTHPTSADKRGKYHYLSTIAAILFASLLVGSLVLVFTHFHPVKVGNQVITPKPGTDGGAWSLTGSMHIAHAMDTATLLRNGKVLVVGNDNPPSAVTELYDPATGKWSLTGNLHIGRGYQTATLLQNGEVLVTGGLTNNNFTASAELYNPSTGTWSLTGSMHVARVNDTATLLPNGKVLVAGGTGDMEETFASAEVYDPATGTWSFTGSMNLGRGYFTATMLSNGKILVAGGATPTGQAAYSEAELYDPSTGEWSLTGSMNIARVDHTATLLSNGKVLVTGGTNIESLPVASAELYNPATGKWSLTGSMHATRAEHTATLLRDGNVLVAGGYDEKFGNHELASAELYNPATGTLQLTASMHTARDIFTATLLSDGKVLVAGGLDYPNEIPSAELYTPTHV